MKVASFIQPRYIIGITVGIAMVMFGSAYYELQQSRQELFHVLEEHSLTLSETIERSSSTIVLSSEYIERQLAERLFNNAYYVARLDSTGALSQAELSSICRFNNIYRINIFNARGARILASHPPPGLGLGRGERFIPPSLTDPVVRGDTDRIVIGFRQARFSGEERFAVAVRRTHRAGGVIVLNMDARQLTEFRKTIGIGRLIADFGNNTEVEYVALQDSDGIIAATDSVDELSSIDHDPALSALLQSDSVVTRRTMFRNREVFEVVRPVTVGGTVAGIVRIGLSMEEIRSVEARMLRRMLIMSLVVIAIGTIVLTAIVANQNYALLSKKFERVKEFTEKILYTMQDMVVTFDAGERITLCNQRAEEFFSVRSDEITGKEVRELPEPMRRIMRGLLSAAETASEHTVTDLSGKEYSFSVTVSKSHSADGSMESKTLLIRDRTEFRRLEREIHRKEKLTAMGELASGVAHEIRNPLNAISMIAQRYEREFVPAADTAEYYDLTSVLKKETARVNGIVQQFLKYARPPGIKKEQLSAVEFGLHLVTLTTPLAESKSVVLRHTAENFPLLIDGGQMTQAVLNLIQNAIDASRRGGEVRFTIRQEGADAVISVADNGEGIPDEQKEKIFNLYYTTKPEGTGVGLAVTHQIVSQHGGTIEVASTSGNGATFLVRLPGV